MKTSLYHSEEYYFAVENLSLCINYKIKLVRKGTSGFDTSKTMQPPQRGKYSKIGQIAL